jgi:DNA-directed RNA polymerase subunit L
MELTVLEQDKNRIKFSLQGAGHTFCNNLKKELYGNKAVEVSSYKLDHPLIGNPTFIVEKTGTAGFKQLLTETTERIKKQNKEFLTAFKKLK